MDATYQAVKTKLAEARVPLALVIRVAGLDYGRVQRVLHGYAQPRDGEVEALLDEIDRLAARIPRAEA